MLHPIIEARKNQWLNAPKCPVKPMLDYMRQRGQLRDAQIAAIETCLFLKFEGGNVSIHAPREGSDPVKAVP
ncbi:MAG: hypothetical protein ACOYYF_14960 [Chloroflexota bacterium]